MQFEFVNIKGLIKQVLLFSGIYVGGEGYLFSKNWQWPFRLGSVIVVNCNISVLTNPALGIG